MICKVCKSSDVEVLGKVRDQDVNAMYCRECDTVFPSCFPSEKELDKYYSGFTANHQYGSKLREQVASYYSKRKCRAILNKIHRYTTVERVLDFGGGSGYFSRGFKLNGVDVDLYDIDRESMIVAKERGINTIESIESVPQYDLVFSSHVIEHYPDLHQFIEQAIAPLKAGGILVVCCPNKNANEFYRHFHCRNYQNRIEPIPGSKHSTSRWFCFDPPRHLYAISKQTIDSLAKTHGLESLSVFTQYSRCSNFHSGDLPFLFLIRPLLKNRNMMIDTVLAVFFSRLMTFMRRRRGDSLVAILRKIK